MAKKIDEAFKRKTKLRYAVWLALRDGSWWIERQKLDNHEEKQDGE